jgi:hypothetical protein
MVPPEGFGFFARPVVFGDFLPRPVVFDLVAEARGRRTPLLFEGEREVVPRLPVRVVSGVNEASSNMHVENLLRTF